MNLTEKYGITMKYDQFARNVPSNFEDPEEKVAIDQFEKYVLQLKDKSKDKFNMIELGSNYSYYSMLFKKILGPQKTFNLLLEPYEKYMKTGKEHFEINNLEGVFLEERIYNPKLWCDIPFYCPSTSIDELLFRYQIEELDVLHCDVDGTESLVLDGSQKSLEEKKIDTIFVMTHPLNSQETSLCRTGQSPTPLHVEIRDRLLAYGYNLMFDHEQCTLGWDSMVIFKR